VARHQGRARDSLHAASGGRPPLGLSLDLPKRKRHRQASLWVETARLTKGPAHPFYRRLNQILGKHGFAEHVERAWPHRRL
jgi:hypothetical protein